jgi:ribosomal protein L37AE/L43A
MRANEIENTFHLVRAAAAEAAELGALVPSFESEMTEARRAFEAGKFRHAVELLAAVERATDSAHIERLRAERDLEARQAEKVKSTVIAYGPVLNEAQSYGLDVREGLVHLENAKMALSRRDVVSAAKYARRVRELAASVDKHLDDKRIQHGVIRHVDDARCGKCGKQALYQYPNAMQKCRECGHAFSTAFMPPPGAPAVAVQGYQSPPPQGYVQQPVQTPESDEDRKKKGVLKW